MTLAGLLDLPCPRRNLMFGTDYPFMKSVPYTLDPLRSHGLNAKDLAAIESGTALTLFPRFAKGIKP